jgi:hypothetical protein
MPGQKISLFPPSSREKKKPFKLQGEKKAVLCSTNRISRQNDFIGNRKKKN